MIHDITDKFESDERDGSDAREKSGGRLIDDPFKKQVSSTAYLSPAKRNSFVDV